MCILQQYYWYQEASDSLHSPNRRLQKHMVAIVNILSEQYIASLVYWGTDWGPGCYLIGVGCYDITGHLLS